ncbi:unnamed protein product [Sphagnum jensenii]|uniref:Anoctamin transmembrane domain-containing protein n=1 Tax=Sphagnum jensenii TaxID=128206 RepID=A0ABP0W506_9BRYO
MEESAAKEAQDATCKGDFASPPYEILIVCHYPKQHGQHKAGVDGEDREDAVEHLCKALTDSGLIIEKVDGMNSELFIKVAAPLEVIGHAADKLMLRKPTHIGLDVAFDWKHKDAFCRQPLGNALFSWTERYQCLTAVINTLGLTNDRSQRLFVPGREGELELNPHETLLKTLKDAGVVKEVFPLHQEKQRKWLLDHWALDWMGLTSQPIDAIYSYFGAKVAIYFAFLGLYTRWLVVPAILGTLLYVIKLRSWQSAVPPVFSMAIVVWAVVFLQFWRRTNAEILTRWEISSEYDELQALRPHNLEQQKSLFSGEATEAQIVEANVLDYEVKMVKRDEWLGRFQIVKTNTVVFAGILCVQLPFELLYAHLNRAAPYAFLKYILTGLYILAIQFFTKKGGQIAVKLTKSEKLGNKEAAANDLIYKVFGIYFMQSYVGLFYQAFFHREFDALRSVLAQRLIITQLLSNVSENLVPYATYRYTKFKAMKADQEQKKNEGRKADEHQPSEVEQEFLKPAYEASIAGDFEDGLFDDFLELAVQFGLVTMFAGAYPLVAAYALANNLVEIRSDALKLLVTMRRPVPKAAASIGAWLTIFQNLGVVAIVTNCAILVCLYDDTANWKLEPGLAAILLLEHLLLLIKIGFSWFVPELPAWIKAKRLQKISVQDQISRELLSTLDQQQLKGNSMQST